MNRTQYLESLASEGLRIASSDESGWTHGYYDDARGEKVATWITDAPAIATPAEAAHIAAEVGVTESQVQGIIDFENAQRELENAQVLKQYQMSTDNDAVAISLPGYDWDWCLDALAKSKAEDAKHIAITIKACILLRNRIPQTLYFSQDGVKFILEAFDAYLSWETPEIQLDLRDLMTDIRRQAGMQLA